MDRSLIQARKTHHTIYFRCLEPEEVAIETGYLMQSMHACSLKHSKSNMSLQVVICGQYTENMQNAICLATYSVT